MKSGLRYAVFDTSQGWIGCLGSAAGLLRITLPQPSPYSAIEMIDGTGDKAVWSPDYFVDIIPLLSGYFNGEKPEFSCKLDFRKATPFQQQVWKVTRTIPYGETRTYGWVASRIGKPNAVRAVGRALGKNPLPIIVPCHRVIGSNGSLCGFNGGLEMKRNLLRLEGLSPG